MEFSLNETQEMFKSTARKFFIEKCTLSNLRAFENESDKYSETLYKEIADLGFVGLIIPEEYGGVGGSLMDLALVLEEAGYATLPSPFFANLVYGTLPILKYGSEEQKQKLLPKIASGEIIISGAFSEPQVNYDYRHVNTVANKVDGSYKLSGSKLFVPFAKTADYFLTLVRTNDSEVGSEAGLSLFLVENTPENVTVTDLPSISPDSIYEVEFIDANVSTEDLLGEVNEAWENTNEIIQTATGLQTIEMAGVLRKALDITTSYVKEREQFNVPIGSFQSVQHRLAEMYTIVEGGSLAAYQSITKIESGLSAEKEIAVAKSWLSKQGLFVLTGAHQLHGGMGVEMDYPLQFCYRQFKNMQLTLGSDTFHLQQIGKNIAKAGTHQYA